VTIAVGLKFLVGMVFKPGEMAAALPVMSLQYKAGSKDRNWLHLAGTGECGLFMVICHEAERTCPGLAGYGTAEYNPFTAG